MNTYPSPEYQDYLRIRSLMCPLKLRFELIQEAIDEGRVALEDYMYELADLEAQLNLLKLQANLALSFGGVFKLKQKLGIGGEQ